MAGLFMRQRLIDSHIWSAVNCHWYSTTTNSWYKFDRVDLPLTCLIMVES